MIVWYFILTLSTGTVVIPQVDHKQCIQNRDMVNNRSGHNFYANAYCFPGAAGVVPNASKAPEEDDDD